MKLKIPRYILYRAELKEEVGGHHPGLNHQLNQLPNKPPNLLPLRQPRPRLLSLQHLHPLYPPQDLLSSPRRLLIQPLSNHPPHLPPWIPILYLLVKMLVSLKLLILFLKLLHSNRPEILPQWDHKHQTHSR